MAEIDYTQQRRNRKKQYYRIRLGVLQMIYKPFLAILLIPIVIATAYIWIKKNFILGLFNVPDFLYPIYKYTFIGLAVILPIIFLLAVFEAIGNTTARGDEADLQEAFREQEQRNGVPVLIKKKRIKGSNVIMREFYTEISIKIWLERQEEIADLMNVHFVEKLKHGDAHGRKIVMYTAKGRETITKGNLYDDEF